MKILTKRMLAVLLAAALLLTCSVCGLVLPASAEATATVKWSDDFEDSSVTDKIKGWRTAFGSTVAEDPEDATNHVWALTKASTASNYVGASWGFVRGHMYELSFRVYIPEGATGYVSINSNNGTRGICGGSPAYVNESGKWVTRKLLMHTAIPKSEKAPDDGYGMVMKVSGAKADKPFYVDDMVFTDLGVFDGNYLLGGDFESSTYASNSSEWYEIIAHSRYDLVTEADGNHCLYLSAGNGKVSPYYKGKIGLQPNTSYQLVMRVKGGAFAVYLNSGKGLVRNTGWTDMNTAGSEDWKEIRLNFATKNSVDDLGYVFAMGLDTGDTTKGVYLDDIRIVEVGKAVTAAAPTGGTLRLTSETDSSEDSYVQPAEGEIVTVKVTPKSGYLMVPGTLTYTDANGKKVKILNESLTENTFGGTAGNSFQFKMPANGTQVTAQFVSTADQTFAMDTIGTSLRVKDDGVTYDGIRFLTRMNMATKFDEEEQTLMVSFGGEEYEIVEFGSLLKRYEENEGVEVELTKENALWTSTAYTKGSGMRLIDYTENYVDFTSVMITNHQDRTYTARGYVVLENAEGQQQTVYCASQLSNSIASASTLL